MKTAFAALLALIVAAIAGCGATVDVTKTAKGFHEPTKPADVEILRTLPDREYLELGTITTNRWDPSHTAKMHNALREKAAGLGADAVVIQNSGVNQVSSYVSYLWATGVALKYK